MKTSLSAPALLVASLLVLSACDTAEERAEKHYQSALELIAAGEPDKAIVELRNVFELNQAHIDARMTYAGLVEDQGKMREAFAQYVYVSEQDPSNLIATKRASNLAIELGAWDTAETLTEAAAGLADDDPDVRVNTLILEYRDAVRTNDQAARRVIAEEAAGILAVSPENLALQRVRLDWLLFSERERDALGVINEMLTIDPENLEMHQVRLGLLESLGETQEVEASLHDLVARFPEDNEIKTALIRWYGAQGDTEGAEEFLRQMVELSPEDDPMRVSLIAFLANNVSAEAAREEIARGIEQGQSSDLFRSLRAGLDFEAGKRDEAIAELEEIVKDAEVSEESLNIRVTLARLLLTNGNPVGSRAVIEGILESDPSHVEALKLQARFLIDADQADDAIRSLRLALAEAPEDHDIMTLTAAAHERNGDRDLMGEMLALAAETSDYTPETSLRLGRFLEAEDRTDGALQAYTDGLRATPGQAELLTQLARLYIRLERWEQAEGIEESLRELGTNPALELADRIRLGILQAQDRNDELISLIDNAADPDNPSANEVFARIRLRLMTGDQEGAQEVLDQALETDPEDAGLRFLQGSFLAASGEPDAALDIYRGILDTNPGAERVWLAYVRLQTALGRFDDARASLDEGLQSLPGSGNLLWAKAGLMERDGQIDEAIAVYEELYELNSANVIVANNLASLLTTYRDSVGDLDRAFQIARRLRGIDQPAFQDTYGWIAYLRGDYEQAERHLVPAAAGLPDDPAVQYHLGRLYESLDRPDEAIAQYQKALDLLDGAALDGVSDDAEQRVAALTQ